MEGKIKIFTYLDFEVHAYTQIYAWLVIRQMCREERIKIPKLKEIKLKEN